MESSTRFHTRHASRPQRAARWLTGAIAVAITAGTTVALQASPIAAAEDCPGGTTELTAAFANTPDGLQGADYQRATRCRRLGWLVWKRVFDSTGISSRRGREGSPHGSLAGQMH